MANSGLKKGRYTQHPNKIGLYNTTKGGFIKNDNDVVLSFPFKDTVLEAGMTKEDVGRDERFLHLELDSKDIDTLEEPKVLTDFRYVDETKEQILSSETDIDFFDSNDELLHNLLIKGNNLLALYSLKQKLAGKVKLIYIDPPYNTGGDSFKYNDNFNHSSWLVFMKNRLEVAKELLSEDGAIFIQLDDNELDYCKVLCDEIFGKDNLMNRITIDARSPSAFSTVNPGVFKASEYLLFYAKDKSRFEETSTRIEREVDYAYNLWLENPEDNYKAWRFKSVVDEYYENTTNSRSNKNIHPKKVIDNYNKFIIKNASKVARLASISDSGAGKKIVDLKKESLKSPNNIFKLEREGDLDDVYITNGQQIIFYSKNVTEIDGALKASKLLTNIWTDIAWEGISSEGNTSLNKGKKPERLLKRIIELSTQEGDIVLDYHLGTGTTSAVAHKMNRRWIGIEQMDYIETKAKNRLTGVVNGEQTGISKYVNWTGGGSFIYFELKKYNQEYIDLIKGAKSLKELETLYVDMRNNAFLKFWFDRKEFEKDENFRSLDLNNRKKALIEILDENQLYLNYADMNDSRHKVSIDEKTLTNKFYGEN